MLKVASILLAWGLAASLLPPQTEVLFAQTSSEVPPPEVALPTQNPLYKGTDLLKDDSLTLRPSKEIASSITPLPTLPIFYVSPLKEKLPDSFTSFFEEILIPGESIYFQPGIGIDPKSSMPYDHIRIRLKENMLSEVGHYTAASKLSLSIPFLLKVIQQKPAFRKVQMSPKQAEHLLKRTLDVLLAYHQKNERQQGFLPWVDIRPNGTIATANDKIPSLDNGQLTWALAAVTATFESSTDPSQKELAEKSQTLLNLQNYKKFYDAKKGLLHGTLQWDSRENKWRGDVSYYLDDMCEGTLAVLWGVLHGQIPECAWENLKIPTTEYITEHQEKITTLKGFRASFHEHWALAFIPFMESALAPLYQNYLYTQADYARIHHLPGFLSTAYDPKGVYRQMGIPEIAKKVVDRDDVSVFFATSMGMLISPLAGSAWLLNFYNFKQFISPYGALESVGRDGYADIFTADAKGMTLLAINGGVLEETQKYLHSRTVPHTAIPMDVKLMELLHVKYKQMLKERHGEPLYFPTYPFPSPDPKFFKVCPTRPLSAGEFFNITDHLQSGHLHGKNVHSVGQQTLEQDIYPGKPIAFEYEIPSYASYFDQWAFRGTYIDKAVRIADMRYLTLVLPVNAPPSAFEVELKSDDITLATVIINTEKQWKLSKSGFFKIFVESIKPIPEAEEKPFNYISVVIHDPRYLMNALTRGGRQGTIVLHNIFLTRAYPFKGLRESATQQSTEISKEFEVIRYWRLSHGDLPVEGNPQRGSYSFSGGRGWRGGYIPYTNLNKFNFIYIKARNLDEEGKNSFCVEFKHEDNQLLGNKIPIILPPDKDWHIFEIRLPKNNVNIFNYLALSDPSKAFELGSIMLAQEVLNDPRVLKTSITKHVKVLHFKP